MTTPDLLRFEKKKKKKRQIPTLKNQETIEKHNFHLKWDLVSKMWLKLVAECELALRQGVVLLARARPVLPEVVLRLRLMLVVQADGLVSITKVVKNYLVLKHFFQS